ncbi:MAG: hypothetical protein ACLU8W_01285 [Clostridia bacterium]
MKKVLAGILSAIILASGGVAGAAAPGSDAGRNFSDTDGDRICDNRIIAQSNGEAPGGQGANYVDADGDGICDHRPDSCPCVGTSGGSPCGDQVQQRSRQSNRNAAEQENGKCTRSRAGARMGNRMGA